MRRIALLLTSLAVIACAAGDPLDFDEGNGGGGVTLQTNLTSFVAADGYFTTACLGTTCHEGVAPPGILVLGRVGSGVTQAQVHNSLRTRPNVVNTANIAASTLLTKPIDPAVSHVGQHPWSDNGPQDQGITIWIMHGATND